MRANGLEANLNFIVDARKKKTKEIQNGK